MRLGLHRQQNPGQHHKTGKSTHHAEQAGLAISFQAFFIFITFGFGLSSAMTALVGNAIGAKQEDEARILAARGMGFGVIITLVLGVTAWFVGPELIKLV